MYCSGLASFNNSSCCVRYIETRSIPGATGKSANISPPFWLLILRTHYSALREINKEYTITNPLDPKSLQRVW